MNKKRVLAMLLAGAMALSMTACGGGNSASTDDSSNDGGASASGGSYKVSVILKTLAAEYWQYVKSGAEDYASEHSDKVTVEVKGPSSETAFDEMQNMIETDLSSGTYDGIVISPLQSDTAAQLVSGTKLPIVAIDTNFDAPEVVSYVGTGNEAAAKKGAIAAVEVKGPSSETAFDEMQNMIETDLSSGTYDGIVISPLQSDTAAQLVSGTKLPIVAIDTNFDAPEVVSYVGTGNEAAAKKGAIAAVEAAKKAGWDEVKCIEIAGVQGDETCAARMKGYEEGVNEAGGEFLTSEVQYADATADRATTAMEAIMQTHPEGIAIICAHNDDTAMAAARAAKGHDAYKNTIFLGFNGDRAACEAILAGQMTMSVAQMAYEMGYKAVETMVQALDGETVDEFVDSGSDVVTPDNAQERLDTLKTQLH
ncbi:MAG: sugar ABC transporter substrate-binding protein [Butyricicoccaceae bacterium]